MTTPTKWYSIRARASAKEGAPKAADIHIYGDIGASWWGDTVTAKQFIDEVNALEVDAITIRINSEGGSVNDGVAIYNAIKRHAAHVTTVIDGAAYSIASLIAMAGDTREMAANATMMLHAPWMEAAGNATDFRELADTLDTFARAMATSYAAATGKTADEVVAEWLDGADHWFTADEAKAAGLVDVVTDEMPIAASLHTRFSRPAPRASAAPAPVAAPAAPPASPKKESSMDPKELEAQAAQARAEGVKAERQRVADIRAKFAPFSRHAGAPELLAQCEADVECSPEVAGQRLLAVLAKGATPAAAGRIETVEDEADKFRAAAQQSILARAGATDDKGQRVVATTANPLRGRSLVALAEASLQRLGVNTAGLSQSEIVARGFTQSGSDFPVLLENTMHKSLQGAYATTPDTWSLWCARGSVSDFRPHKRYKVGSLSNLELLTELGEFKNKSIPDGQREQISAATKGNLINLSRQAIINDDLAIFSTLAAALGRAAKRTIEADAYALLVSGASSNGPTLQDGGQLFNATATTTPGGHANLAASGAAPTTTTFEAARVAMARQMDISNNDYLDVRPSVVLCPIQLGATVRQVLGAEYDDEASKNQRRPNVVRDLVRTIVDTPRLGGTAWYLFADPQVVPTFEVVFLDGNDTPYLESQNGWTVDGTVWKVRLDFGVGAVDYKGAYRNPGA